MCFLENSSRLIDVPGEPTHCMELVDSYFKGVHAVLLLYDLTEPKTLRNLESWNNRIISISESRNRYRPPTWIVGNKSDLMEYVRVSPEEELHLADHLGATYGGRISSVLDREFLRAMIGQIAVAVIHWFGGVAELETSKVTGLVNLHPPPASEEDATEDVLSRADRSNPSSGTCC